MQGLQDVSCMEDHVQTIPRPFEMGALDLAEVIECHFEPRVRQTVFTESTSSLTTHESGFTRIRSVSDSQNLYSSFRRTHTHTPVALLRHVVGTSPHDAGLALRCASPVLLQSTWNAAVARSEVHSYWMEQGGPMVRLAELQAHAADGGEECRVRPGGWEGGLNSAVRRRWEVRRVWGVVFGSRKRSPN